MVITRLLPPHHSSLLVLHYRHFLSNAGAPLPSQPLQSQPLLLPQKCCRFPQPMSVSYSATTAVFPLATNPPLAGVLQMARSGASLSLLLVSLVLVAQLKPIAARTRRSSSCKACTDLVGKFQGKLSG